MKITQPLVNAVLHGHRQEQLGADHQCRTLTRDEALRLYAAANGWFVKEEDKLGSIEEGKLPTWSC